MFKILTSAAALLVLSVPGAWGACPPTNPGSLPEAIKENGQRIVCIQNDLAAASTQRNYEFQLKSLERSLQDVQMQRRFDALPKVPVFVPIPVYAP